MKWTIGDFSNPGTKLKKITEYCFTIECAVSVIAAVWVGLFSENFSIAEFASGIGILIGSVAVAYLSNLFFYGIGDMMENIADAAEHSRVTRNNVNMLVNSQTDRNN